MIKENLQEIKVLFKDMKVGDEFRQGKYRENGVDSFLIFEKISPSKGKVLQSVPEGYRPRLVNSVHHFGANAIVWKYE